MPLQVRVYGDACLRQPAEPVDDVGVSERMLIASMLESMHKEKGIGLAAPQVGISRQIFVADIGEGPIVFVNPKIIKRSGKTVMEEGCLSIPGVHVDVERAEKVVVDFIDEQNQALQGVFSGLLARVIQHETDHLHGRLIIDYASKKKLKEIQAALDKIQSNQN